MDEGGFPGRSRAPPVYIDGHVKAVSFILGYPGAATEPGPYIAIAFHLYRSFY